MSPILSLKWGHKGKTMRKPFFNKTHGAWYEHHHGKMVRLHADKEQVFSKYHELMSAGSPSTNADTVASLLNSYLEWCQKNRSERTYEWYQNLLSSFARSIGTKLQIGRLKAFHVTEWSEGKEWSNYSAMRMLSGRIGEVVKAFYPYSHFTHRTLSMPLDTTTSFLLPPV